MRLEFGKIKFFAQQWIRGFSIPLFRDNCINRAINDHIRRIRDAQTRRRRQE